MLFSFFKRKPLVSIIIVAYDMSREVPRTVYSFLPEYQEGIQEADVEILVMENGSKSPIPPKIIDSWPSNVRYIKLENTKASPAFALNEGVRLARGRIVCPVIDGARMVTPGVLKAALSQMDCHPSPVVATVGYHLGKEKQQLAVKDGYNQRVEDGLLKGIDWPKNPYKLFDISSLGGSAGSSWLSEISESNVLFLHKSFYQEIGGYDERFDIPGGGLVNLDFFKRCLEYPGIQYILLVGEGSFHQFHGGVTTSRSVSETSIEDDTRTTWQLYADQYEQIRGGAYSKPTVSPILYGKFRKEAKEEVFRLMGKSL